MKITRQRLLACVFSYCAIFADLAIATAQTSPQGSVRGYVKDGQGAVLPGVVVTATSPESQVPHVATTDGTGLYRLLELPAAEYRVTAELPGFSRFVRDGVVVRAGLNLGVDIVLQIGSLADTVEVKAETPLIESSSAAQATNVSGEFQRALPLSARRDWHEFLLVTPGIIVTDAGSSSPSYFAYGADSNSNVIQIDGAEANSAMSGSVNFIKLDAEAIGDVQVKTAAVDATAPLGVGVIMNLATRSGVNRFSGSAGLAYQSRKWSANNNPGGSVGESELIQPDVSGGGPVVRDHSWWFASFQHRSVTEGISRTPRQVATLKALVPTFASFDNHSGAAYVFVKSTTQVTPTQQLAMSYMQDRDPATFGNATGAENFSTIFTGGPMATARLSSVWGTSLTTRATISYNAKDQENSLVSFEKPTRPVTSRVLLSGGQLVGTDVIARLDNFGSPAVDFPYRKLTIAGDASLYVAKGAGSHELKVGFYLQPLWHERTVRTYPAGGFQIEELVLRDPNDATLGAIPFHRRVFDSAIEPRLLTDTSDYAGYIQEAWRPNPRVTVNAGVRVDVVSRFDKLFSVPIQRSTEIGPRLGINYLVTKDGRTSVRGGFGRIHQALGSSPTSGTNSIGRKDFYDLNLDGTFETVFVTPGASSLSKTLIVAPDYHQPFINEWSASVQRALKGRTTVDVAFDRREYRELQTQVEINGIYANGAFAGYKDETQNAISLLTNNTWNWPVVTSLTTQFAKETTRAQILASYVRQWRHLAGSWQPNDPSSFLQPTVFANDKGLDGPAGSTRAQYQDHVVRLGAAFVAPWGLNVATTYSLQSGPYSGPIQTSVATPSASVGPPTLTLSNGRVVTNPLATTIRYAYDSRGTNQLKLPALHNWSIRIGREFKIAKGRLNASCDIFNITNNSAYSYFSSDANKLFSATYGLADTRQLPRSADVSVRFSF